MRIIKAIRRNEMQIQDPTVVHRFRFPGDSVFVPHKMRTIPLFADLAKVDISSVSKSDSM